MRDTLFNRWSDKILIGNDCWEWTGARTKNGYGQIYDARAGRCPMLSAHRVAYEFMIGPIPEGMCVLHRCDNRGCVKPSHLFLGTQKDNLQDAKKKGRTGRVGLRGERNGRAKLSPEEVHQIRELQKSGEYGVDIARAYGVSPTLVSRIKLGRLWGWMS